MHWDETGRDFDGTGRHWEGTGKQESDTEKDKEALQGIGMNWTRLRGTGKAAGDTDSSYKAGRVVTIPLLPPQGSGPHC